LVEACPAAHHWARELQAIGHTVKLMPPSYVKAYLKRSKNDANDAAAICEAVTRPSMRFVAVKTKEQQAALMLHRARQLLVRQRTMLSNAIRGHLAELGIVSAKGRNGTRELLEIITNDADRRIPLAARRILKVLAAQYSAIGAEITSIGKSILAWHRACEPSRRLEEIPGIGPIVATALVAEIGDWKAFRSGRGLAAWIGLVPKQPRPAAKTSSAALRSRAIDTCGGFSSPVPWPSSACAEARHEEASVAGAVDGAPADQGGGRCLGQQDRPDGVGDHGSRREIQGAGAIAGRVGSRQIGTPPIGEGMTT
jgi:transposase